MRKSIVSPAAGAVSPIGVAWRDLVRIARVEMTSENEAFPIEAALAKTETTGWRAASKGPQVVRLHFDERWRYSGFRSTLWNARWSGRRSLRCLPRAKARCAKWCGSSGALRRVARPRRLEDYEVALIGVTAIELRIDPDRSHDPTQSKNFATLASLRIA